jgi:hypothetical protein
LRKIKQCLGAIAVTALAAASLSAGPVSAATHGIVRTKAQWQAAMAQVRERGAGCYHASYPALRWHAAKCATAPRWPVAPALPARSPVRAAPMTVGDGVDYSAQVSGLISQATGTFQDVSPKITEKGKSDNQGSKIANTFSLQLNTQFFATPVCAQSGDPAKCLGWQQFVYAKSDGAGLLFMQYWLINYDATCPSGWFTFSTDCYTNSSAAELASPLTAKELATLKLSGSAASGGNDAVSLSVGSGKATLVTNNDSELDLASVWNTTEWGVFGDGGGGEAFFGTGTTLEAQTALTTTSHSAPKCVKEGFTAETNNLKLASTPALGSEPSPTMASRQTNGTTGTASCAVAA